MANVDVGGSLVSSGGGGGGESSDGVGEVLE